VTTCVLELPSETTAPPRSSITYMATTTKNSQQQKNLHVTCNTRK